MKKLLSFLFSLLILTAPALATETVDEASDEPTSILELTKTAEPQTLQFFLGAPANELPGEMNFETEFFYQKLLERLNSDFSLTDKILLTALAILALAIFFFLLGLTVLFFIFRTRWEMQARELKNFTKETRTEFKKEHEFAEHNLQSIIDSQQHVLNDLKKSIEEKLQKI